MTYMINSKAEPHKVLCSVITAGLYTDRVDASDHTEILQVSTICMSQGRVVPPHRHVSIERTTLGTQEAWIVVSGQLQVQVFDTDDTFVEQLTLTAGQCMTLFRGGHTFTVLTDNTVIFEIKNGPYYGQQTDMKQIG